MELGKFGVWTSYRMIGEENAGAAAKLVQELGFGSFWLGGSPKLPAVRPLLETTNVLSVSTGIVNVWQNEPDEVSAAYAELAHDFPARLLVGIGIGHPEATSDYSRPLATMRAFLDGLDRSDPPLPRDRRCMAALGPKMLDLSAKRSLGTHSYFVPVAHTCYARERLGDERLLAPEMACVVDTDAERARVKARQYARLYLGLRNYTGNLLKFGFTEEDIADEGSDRLIDAIIPHGSAAQVAAAAQDHLAAGADHVCLQPVGVSGVPTDEWTALASALQLEPRPAHG